MSHTLVDSIQLLVADEEESNKKARLQRTRCRRREKTGIF